MTTMRYRRLGATGLQVSALSLGSWGTIGERLDLPQSVALVDVAFQQGINFFDSAETYADGGAESMLGAVLRQLGLPRETYLVSGKVFWGVHGKRPNTWGLSRKHVVEGCHASLRRLQVDHLDLYLCHRHDPGTPLAETVSAMSDLVRQGKVLYWGTSEWPASLVEEAHRLATERGEAPPVVEQLQYNLLERRRVEQDFAGVRQRLGLGITTWSPLAYGLLAGRYDDSFPEDARLSDPAYGWLRETVFGQDETGVLARVRAVNALAGELGLHPATLALAWVLRNPAVDTAICGASRPSQLAAQLAALDVADTLGDEVLTKIDDLLSGSLVTEQASAV
ncbi:aldo/keto reductase [Lentzea sp. NPDC004789]